MLDTDNSQLAKACGTTKPAVLKSMGNKMTVVFHSDYSQVYKGFSATWKAVEADTMPTSGEVMSPNYPENYPDNLDMEEYKIVVAPGKKIELTIIDMAIEADGSVSSVCPYDNLKVYDTPAVGARSLIAVRIFSFFIFTITFLYFNYICSLRASVAPRKTSKPLGLQLARLRLCGVLRLW